MTVEFGAVCTAASLLIAWCYILALQIKTHHLENDVKYLKNEVSWLRQRYLK